MKLLLAEDTKDLNRAVSAILAHDGFEVDSTFDGEEALEHIKNNTYDGIILDIMMPKMDGLEVLRELRNLNIMTPVMLLTAKAEVDDRVNGLDAGADDYLTKPFAMKELLARIRAMTRRKSDYTQKQLTFSDVTLSSGNFELKCENTVSLSNKEFELMQLLILNAGKDLDNNYIIERVWPDNEKADENIVYLYISYLRGKLESVASRTQIVGDKGGSYCLVRA
ncbi:MAG: response regulator transcription factor [Lachnospiraceae bacterium]|nr:response regulator transcription factor [Lachnospiraceae bacterium]